MWTEEELKSLDVKLSTLRAELKLMESQHTTHLAQLELTVQELRHRTDDLYAWQPLPDGAFPFYSAAGNDLIVELLHGGHQIVIKERGVNILLPINVRLCRRD